MTGIEDLYYQIVGNPREGIAGVSMGGLEEEFSKLSNQISEKLHGNVSQEIENSIEELQMDMNTYNECFGFKAGFKLGVKLMTEVFAHE